MSRDTVISAVGLLLAALLGASVVTCADLREREPQTVVETRVDTLVVRDTVTAYKPVPVNVYVVDTLYVPVPVPDRIRCRVPGGKKHAIITLYV